jgi:cytochrome c peroxidase
MRKSLFCQMGIAIVLAGLFCGCGTVTPPPPRTVEIDPVQIQIFEPALPDIIESASNPITEQKVALGRMLYFEPRLSKSHQISCNSCHGLDTFGVDGVPTSDGHKGQLGTRNAPTVYNAAGHFVQFWDGRAPDVEAQAKGPILNPVEMAMPSEKYVLTVLNSMPEYVAAFKAAFPGEKDPVSYDNMAKAIGAFERKLVTPARWDKFVKGDKSALSPEEKAGFATYMEVGCQGCHAGTYVGGNTYQRLGMVKAWPDASDPGREKVTKNASDQMVFKVPSLRNIEKTGPYFHNGKIGTLAEAIQSMGEYQLGKKLSDAQVQSIITWLRTLTGDVPAEYTKPPVLPKSTSKTPKPDISD